MEACCSTGVMTRFSRWKILHIPSHLLTLSFVKYFLLTFDGCGVVASCWFFAHIPSNLREVSMMKIRVLMGARRGFISFPFSFDHV
jgi:hypothetical protein